MNSSLKTLAMSLVLASSLMITAAAAEVIGTGTVTGSGLRVRSQANTSSTILTKLNKGAKVDVVEELEGWYKIVHNGSEAYVSASYIDYTEKDPEAGETAEAVEEAETQEAADEKDSATYGVVTASSVNVRSGPGTKNSKIGSLKAGAKVTILEELDGWYKISCEQYQEGYMSADYIAIVDGDSSIGQQAVDLAMKYMGYKYVSGAASPSKGFDCSGLTSYVYKQLGYTIPRSSKTQAKYGLPVSKDQLQPGDLVFFRSASSKAVSHVGLYIGDGKIIHARYSIRKVTINSLSESYYTRYYLHAMRVVY